MTTNGSGSTAPISIAAIVALMQTLGVAVDTSFLQAPAPLTPAPAHGPAAGPTITGPAVPTSQTLVPLIQHAGKYSFPNGSSQSHQYAGLLAIMAHSMIMDEQVSLAYICGTCYIFNCLSFAKENWYAVIVSHSPGTYNNRCIIYSINILSTILTYLAASKPWSRLSVFLGASRSTSKHFQRCRLTLTSAARLERLCRLVVISCNKFMS